MHDHIIKIKLQNGPRSHFTLRRVIIGTCSSDESHQYFWQWYGDSKVNEFNPNFETQESSLQGLAKVLCEQQKWEYVGQVK